VPVVLQPVTIPRLPVPAAADRVLVDSSVWIPYLRGDRTISVEYLVGALEHREPVWLAPPVLQEVLQGADRPERFERWDRILGELPMLAGPEPRAAARAAARLYARCRWSGVTPRSANDCLIAVHALHAAVPLLHNDADFVRIAGIERRLVLLPARG
jgi:predicted nucleic acid-binding protein